MTKVKKNKMKTHKGTKKVLNIRQSGSISKSRQGTLVRRKVQLFLKQTTRELKI